jgi:glucose-6-phosphate 1-dehydrogenase
LLAALHANDVVVSLALKHTHRDAQHPPVTMSVTPPPRSPMTNEEYAHTQHEQVTHDLECEEWHCQPLTVFVFGASGDLAKKKTYPALIDLFKAESLSSRTLIVGTARSDMSDEAFRDHLKPFLEKQLGTDDAGNADVIERFLAKCIYRSAQYGDSDALQKISGEVEEYHAAQGKVAIENRLFYLALPPSAFVSTARGVKDGAMSNKGFNRVVVEKPFGRDTESASKLGKDLGEIFDESFLYRIDHYLGKELVQNMVVLRFGNTFLEPIWNHKYVKSVVISFKEDIGTMGRGGYFDQSGRVGLGPWGGGEAVRTRH